MKKRGLALLLAALLCLTGLRPKRGTGIADSGVGRLSPAVEPRRRSRSPSRSLTGPAADQSA